MTGTRRSAPLLAAARSMAVDHVTAEVVAALDAAGIECVLLKGPTLQWLYDGEPRPYSDTDLMVPDCSRSQARDVLSNCGFRDVLAGCTDEERSPHADTWVREADGAKVDLHRTIIGPELEPPAIWQAAWDGSETTVVGGCDVRVPGATFRALHIALHAAQHGSAFSKAMNDLRRALERIPEARWVEVVELASALRAESALTTGLSLVPAGRELARRLGLRRPRDAGVRLRAQGVTDMPLAMELLAQTRGVRQKLAYAARRMFPSRAFMRLWFPPAARGRFGLVLAYAWRPLVMSARAIPAFLVWRRARKDARG